MKLSLENKSQQESMIEVIKSELEKNYQDDELEMISTVEEMCRPHGAFDKASKQIRASKNGLETPC